MSVGFLGIQFGWGLQMANTSAIFEYLGANPEQIPILWLAAPLTGLLVNPVVGYLSDRTWCRWGRRRPYFLGGALLSSLALIAMPNSGNLWMAAGSLWILDTAANLSMEPFRAFVGDLLPAKQRTQGFALQSLCIGLGAVSAAALPWLLTHGVFPVASSIDSDIPRNVKYAFYAGAAVFVSAVLWTALSTKEKPPEDLAASRQRQVESDGLWEIFPTLWQALREMPPTMRQLAWVQFFTWTGLYCFFLYFPPAVAWNVFEATYRGSPVYTQGIEWAGLCVAFYDFVCLSFSFVLPLLAKRISRKYTHLLCLLCGATGLISLQFIHDPYGLFGAMIGVGMIWASVLSMPYAILVGALPKGKRGTYMGLFNIFIVLPEIVASLGLGWVIHHWLHDDRMLAVALGGSFLLLGAIAMVWVRDPAAERSKQLQAQRHPIHRESTLRHLPVIQD